MSTKLHSFSGFIRPATTLLTVVFFFGILATGLYLNKISYDKATDIMSGIWGMVVGYWFAKRENANGST